MPEHDFFEARVIVDGQALEEYDAPNDEQAKEGEIIRYIQAIPGKRFGILVKRQVGCGREGATDIYFKLKLDGGLVLGHGEELPEGTGALYSQHEYTFDHSNVKNESGKWKQMYFEFGILATTENATEDANLTSDRLSMLGSLQICCYRAIRKVRTEPYEVPDTMPRPLEPISEKLLKGHSIKTNVRYGMSERDAKPYGVQTHAFTPVPGHAGRKTIFIFKYRTKETLQSLGCIPRSQADRESELRRTEEMLGREKEGRRRAELEVTRLRQQLQQIQRRINGGIQNEDTWAGKREGDVKDEANYD